MKLSVIIAYYNAELYIFHLLESLLEQGFSEEEFEIIVVDDGSTHSVDKLKDFCDSHSNVHYVWQKNAKQSVARNNGLSMAKGEYVFICDNDDKVNKHVFSKLYDIAHSNNLDMLFFNRIMIGEDEKNPVVNLDFCSLEEICTGQQYLAKHPRTSTGPWHYITKRSFAVKNHLKFPEGRILSEDVDFLINACVVAQRVSYVNVDVYYWIQRSKSISHRTGTGQLTEKLIENMLWHIDERQKMIADQPNLNPQFVLWLRSNLHGHAYRIMRTAFMYLSYERNKELLSMLEDRGEYPLKKDNNSPGLISSVIMKIMNIKSIWLCCCFLINIMPEFVRTSIHKSI